jgi:hypothetical protein
MSHKFPRQILCYSREKRIKFNNANIPSCCDTCLAGKFTSLPFAIRRNRASEVLDIIHTDLCGPMRTNSFGEARYFITFIDDYSRWCEIYFLKDKSEAAEKFEEYKNLVETRTGHKIKAV